MPPCSPQLVSPASPQDSQPWSLSASCIVADVPGARRRLFRIGEEPATGGGAPPAQADGERQDKETRVRQNLREIQNSLSGPPTATKGSAVWQARARATMEGGYEGWSSSINSLFRDSRSRHPKRTAAGAPRDQLSLSNLVDKEGSAKRQGAKRENAFRFATDARHMDQRAQERMRKLEQEREREFTFKPSTPHHRWEGVHLPGGDLVTRTQTWQSRKEARLKQLRHELDAKLERICTFQVRLARYKCHQEPEWDSGQGRRGERRVGMRRREGICLSRDLRFACSSYSLPPHNLQILKCF